MPQPTTKYFFSPDIFKRIREATPETRLAMLEKEVEHLRNKIRGHIAFQTKLIRTLNRN